VCVCVVCVCVCVCVCVVRVREPMHEPMRFCALLVCGAPRGGCQSTKDKREKRTGHQRPHLLVLWVSESLFAQMPLRDHRCRRPRALLHWPRWTCRRPHSSPSRQTRYPHSPLWCVSPTSAALQRGGRERVTGVQTAHPETHVRALLQ
jgi:hypothetical protein